MSEIELKEALEERPGSIEALVERMQQLESRRVAAVTLLRELAHTPSRRDFLSATVNLFQQWSGCRCVGLRILDERGDVPYVAHVGYSDEFWRAENHLSVTHDDCVCTRVITGCLLTSDGPMASAAGSFCCNHAAETLAEVRALEPDHYRTGCLHAHYQTVAVVPIRYRDRVLGAIHFADERPDRMPPATLDFVETLAPLVGEAAQRFAVEDTVHYQAELIDRASNAIVATERDGRIRVWNAAAETLFGYTADEVRGRPVGELVRPVMPRRRVERLTAALWEKGAWRGEVKLRRRDRGVVPTLVSATVLHDGQGQRVGDLLVISDLTELKRAEETLRRREEFHRIVLENALDLVVVIDAKGVVRYVNPAYERALGWPPSQAVGRPASELVHPDDLPTLVGLATRAREGEDAVAGEFRCRHRDGTWRYFEGQARSLAAGRRRRDFLVSAHDVTERRRILEQLLQAQKMEAVGRLAGGVAHDFNNLLMVIKGYAGLIRDEMKPTGQLGLFIDEILKAATRAARLPQQLLAFSRRQVLEQKVASLGDLVADMEKMLHRLIGEHIQLVAERDPELWPTRVDTGQLEQVIVNLVVNARDAMPAGGRLIIETANVPAGSNLNGALAEPVTEDMVLLRVTDTGCGMSEEVQRHLFEPFYTTKEVGRGTGLGLATVYGVIKQHQGLVVVETEPGAGTTFRVLVPRAPEALVAALRPRELAELPGGHETVLLAEDEPTLRAMLSRILTRLGYAIIDAENGEEALRRASEHEGAIDLLVTDMVMPVMSGWELQRRLETVRPGLRTLFMSGYSDNPMLQKAVQTAGVGFLAKPFNEAELARKVRELLDR